MSRNRRRMYGIDLYRNDKLAASTDLMATGDDLAVEAARTILADPIEGYHTAEVSRDIRPGFFAPIDRLEVA